MLKSLFVGSVKLDDSVPFLQASYSRFTSDIYSFDSYSFPVAFHIMHAKIAEIMQSDFLVKSSSLFLQRISTALLFNYFNSRFFCKKYFKERFF